MEENKYLHYQGMVTTITAGIARLDGVCRHVSMDTQADELKAVNERLQNHIFSVGIMGEFRKGKSTIINALLGQEIVPADIVPTSATLNYVRWDNDKHAEIRFKNGTKKEIPVDELAGYVTKITKESEAMSATVEDATVFYPCPFCQQGVQIVDTPGLNDDERMTAISENVIPTFDAIIMALVPDSPFSQSEAEFVRNKLMASDLGRLIFVLNKIDIVDEDDRPRLLNAIKEKIETSVLEKMAAVYGEQSDEYKKAKEKIGDIKVLPVSARMALKGKIKKDLKLIEDSGYIEFEKVLSKMLTEERGILELIHPINKIMSVSKIVLETLQTRQEALNIDAQEFQKIKEESIEKINETRQKKKEEITILKSKGKTLYADLLPNVSDVYSEVENSLSDFAFSYPISDTDLNSENSIQNFSEKVSAEIDKKLEDILSIHTERIIYKVRENLGNDVEELKEFSIELDKKICEIRDSIALKCSNDNKSEIGKEILFDVGGMYATIALLGANIPGLGGLMAGFKEHGVKGAVTGGLSGTIIGFSAAILASSVGILGLPFALIAGTASTFGGKAITNLIFGKKDKKTDKKADDLRLNLTDSVKNIVEKLRQAHTLESWLKQTCEDAYGEMAVNIDKEWEMSLTNMEDTLTQIKIDIEMNAANKEKCENDMIEQEKEILSILDSIKTVQNKLTGGV